MKRTIYKYPLAASNGALGGPVRAKLPIGAEVLCVQTQYNEPKLWALADPDETRTEWRRLLVLGTGWEPVDLAVWSYLSTFQLNGGALVFHVFQQSANVEESAR